MSDGLVGFILQGSSFDVHGLELPAILFSVVETPHGVAVPHLALSSELLASCLLILSEKYGVFLKYHVESLDRYVLIPL